MNTPMPLEAAMLLCFGIAWPVATMKMLRTGRAEGKGLGFTTIIRTGYVAGAVSKLVALDAGDAPLPRVFWLYLPSSATVGCNGWLQWYLPRHSAPATSVAAPPLGNAGAR